MQIAFPKSSPEAQRLTQLLTGIEEKEKMYVLSMAKGINENGKIGVMPRSLLSCMYYLCQSVQIPQKHQQEKIAPLPELSKEEFKEWQHVVTDLMKVEYSKRKPKSAYVAIPYRGFWFYIADSDVKSKLTFMLLLQLYQLQASEQKTTGPLLTLPLG